MRNRILNSAFLEMFSLLENSPQDFQQLTCPWTIRIQTSRASLWEGAYLALPTRRSSAKLSCEQMPQGPHGCYGNQCVSLSKWTKTCPWTELKMSLTGLVRWLSGRSTCLASLVAPGQYLELTGRCKKKTGSPEVAQLIKVTVTKPVTRV